MIEITIPGEPEEHSLDTKAGLHIRYTVRDADAGDLAAVMDDIRMMGSELEKLDPDDPKALRFLLALAERCVCEVLEVSENGEPTPVKIGGKLVPLTDNRARIGVIKSQPELAADAGNHAMTAMQKVQEERSNLGIALA